MIAAVDTNVLLDILIPNTVFMDSSLSILESSADKGRLIISEIVFTELATQFDRIEDLRMFLKDTDIELVNSDIHALDLASRGWKNYLTRRKKQQNCPHCKKLIPGRSRIISDFIIGGHAHSLADCLISRDRGFYRDYFNTLKIIAPYHKERHFVLTLCVGNGTNMIKIINGS